MPPIPGGPSSSPAGPDAFRAPTQSAREYSQVLTEIERQQRNLKKLSDEFEHKSVKGAEAAKKAWEEYLSALQDTGPASTQIVEKFKELRVAIAATAATTTIFGNETNRVLSQTRSGAPQHSIDNFLAQKQRMATLHNVFSAAKETDPDKIRKMSLDAIRSGHEGTMVSALQRRDDSNTAAGHDPAEVAKNQLEFERMITRQKELQAQLVKSHIQEEARAKMTSTQRIVADEKTAASSSAAIMAVKKASQNSILGSIARGVGLEKLANKELEAKERLASGGKGLGGIDLAMSHGVGMASGSLAALMSGSLAPLQAALGPLAWVGNVVKNLVEVVDKGRGVGGKYISAMTVQGFGSGRSPFGAGMANVEPSIAHLRPAFIAASVDLDEFEGRSLDVTRTLGGFGSTSQSSSDQLLGFASSLSVVQAKAGVMGTSVANVLKASSDGYKAFSLTGPKLEKFWDDMHVGSTRANMGLEEFMSNIGDIPDLEVKFGASVKDMFQHLGGVVGGVGMGSIAERSFLEKAIVSAGQIPMSSTLGLGAFSGQNLKSREDSMRKIWANNKISSAEGMGVMNFQSFIAGMKGPELNELRARSPALFAVAWQQLASQFNLSMLGSIGGRAAFDDGFLGKLSKINNSSDLEDLTGGAVSLKTGLDYESSQINLLQKISTEIELLAQFLIRKITASIFFGGGNGDLAAASYASQASGYHASQRALGSQLKAIASHSK